MALVTDRNALLHTTEDDDSMELYSDSGQPAEDIDIDFDREETVPSVNDDLMLDDVKSDIDMPADAAITAAADEAMLDDEQPDVDLTEVPEEGMNDDDVAAPKVDDAAIREDDEELLDFTDMDEPEATLDDTITQTLPPDPQPTVTAAVAEELPNQSAATLQNDIDAGPEDGLTATHQLGDDVEQQLPEEALPQEQASRPQIADQPVEYSAKAASIEEGDVPPASQEQNEAEYLEYTEDPQQDSHTSDSANASNTQAPVVDTNDATALDIASASVDHTQKLQEGDAIAHPDEAATKQPLSPTANGTATPTTRTGLHPIICHLYATDPSSSSSCPLFPLQSQIEGSEYITPFLLEDENLVNSSFADLLKACRQHINDNIESVPKGYALTARIGDDLCLDFDEDSLSAHSTSLYEVLELYLQLCANDLGEELAPPLTLLFDYKVRPDALMEFFSRHIKKGRGLFTPDHDAIVAFYSETSEQQDQEQLITNEQTDEASHTVPETTQSGQQEETTSKPHSSAAPNNHIKQQAEEALPDGQIDAVDKGQRDQSRVSDEAASEIAERDFAKNEAADDDLDYDDQAPDVPASDGQALEAKPQTKVEPLAAKPFDTSRRSASPNQFPRLQPKARRESVPSISVSITSAPRDDELDNLDDVKAGSRHDRSKHNGHASTAKFSVTDDGILSGVTGSATSAVMDGDPDILDFTDDEYAGETATSRRKSGDKASAKRVRDDSAEFESASKKQDLKRQKSS